MVNSQLSTILLLVAIGSILYWMNNQQNNETTEGLEDVISLEENSSTVENSLVEEESGEDIPVIDESTQVTDTLAQVGENGPTAMSFDSSAAGLDTAFMGAVPPNTAVDQVDFNRNNVTEYDSSQFLPKEINDEWFDTDFTKAKYNLNDDKMINTNRYMIGVNTVGQSLKNPAYDIRGTIPNPKYTVSPWNNSTYEPDNNLKPLC